MADPRILTFDGAPNLAWLFARAAATSFARATHGVGLEDVEVRRPKVRVDRTQLAAYDRVCGFPLRDALPATYLHVLVFPLQVALMADRSFPLGLPGLVHIRSRMVQHRPVVAAEMLSLRSTPQGLRPHAKGAQVDLVGEVRVGDELVWEGVSTYLARGAFVPGEIAAERPIMVDFGSGGRANAVWHVPGDMGRRYAAVSGDVNPMHLNPWAARAFGFPRALVHGMWTKAHALAALDARLPESYAVDVAFSKPLLLPSVANFIAVPQDCAAQQDHGWDFAVRPARGTGDHLRGTIRAI